MSATAAPRALRPFLMLPQALRAEGFPAAPEQTEGFVAAVGLLGPASLDDVRRAARAVFGPAPERWEAFDAVFDSVFLGRRFAAPAAAEGDDEAEAFDAGGFDLPPDAGEADPSGREATAAERLFLRTLDAADPEAALRQLRRLLPQALPRRRSRRLAGRHGALPDPRRAFRDMLRRDGELVRLPVRRRGSRQRPVVLLVDVSGSMKATTDGVLRLAHTLVQAGERVEVFTLGTRLTRVTRALRHRAREQALTLASGLVADWDGGTRLGEALATFLAVPRFVAAARGALVVLVSDGLERGGPEALVAATARLRALAHKLVWLSPLAATPGYVPETAAMRAIMPILDRLGDGSSPHAIGRELLALKAVLR